MVGSKPAEPDIAATTSVDSSVLAIDLYPSSPYKISGL